MALYHVTVIGLKVEFKANCQHSVGVRFVLHKSGLLVWICVHHFLDVCVSLDRLHCLQNRGSVSWGCSDHIMKQSRLGAPW